MIGDETFSNRKELLKGKLDRNQMKRMIETNVMECHVYGSQTIGNEKRRYTRLGTLEMPIWRKMEKITWTIHNNKLRGNDWIRRGPDIPRKRQRNWNGHGLSFLKYFYFTH